MSPRTLTCLPCLYGSNKGLVLPLRPTQLQVMELGVERVDKGRQPLQGIQRGMGVSQRKAVGLGDVFDVVWYLAAAERLYGEG